MIKNVKLNPFQVAWLRRVAATPEGRLLVRGPQQMQSRTRDFLRDAGLVLWEEEWRPSRAHREIAYVITPKGREALRRREENAATKAAGLRP